MTTTPKNTLNPNYRQKLGALGEKIACQFLLKKGYQLLRKNFLIRGGQIDLIMLSPQHNLIFIEVKTRYSRLPQEESIVSHHQLKTLQNTARQFLATISFPFVTWQLDLIWIHFDRLEDKIPKAKIKHYQNILEI